MALQRAVILTQQHKVRRVYRGVVVGEAVDSETEFQAMVRGGNYT